MPDTFDFNLETLHDLRVVGAAHIEAVDGYRSGHHLTDQFLAAACGHRGGSPFLLWMMISTAASLIHLLLLSGTQVSRRRTGPANVG